MAQPTDHERALASSPVATTVELRELAVAYRELWPDVAANPNVYPELIEWMKVQGFVPEPVPNGGAYPVATGLAEFTADPAPTLAVETDVPVAEERIDFGSQASPGTNAASEPELEARIQRTGTVGSGTAQTGGRPRTKIFLIAGAAVVVASVIVSVAIASTSRHEAPRQQQAESTEEPTPDPEAEAKAALDKAVSDFYAAVQACRSANIDYDDALDAATVMLTTDPAILTDPSMLDTLQSAIDANSDVEKCVSPVRAEEIDAIIAQTADIQEQITLVTTATKALTDAGAPVYDILEQVRLAAEAEAEAADLLARTWTFATESGYSYEQVIEVGPPIKDGFNGDWTVGTACSYDPSTDVAIPVTSTVRATTMGYNTPVRAGFLIQHVGDSYSGVGIAPYNGDLRLSVERYFSDGTECDIMSSSNYADSTFGVQWTDPMSKGVAGSFTFTVIIEDYYVPATPLGDTALLDWITILPQGGKHSDLDGSYQRQSGEGGAGVSLTNKVVW